MSAVPRAAPPVEVLAAPATLPVPAAAWSCSGWAVWPSTGAGGGSSNGGGGVSGPSGRSVPSGSTQLSQLSPSRWHAVLDLRLGVVAVPV